MRTLYIDCAFGISGDMFLAALADLGVDFSKLEKIFEQAGIKITVALNDEQRCGVAGRQVDIIYSQNQPLRTLKDILPLIQGLKIQENVAHKAIRAFEQLARVEGRVHNLTPDRVHFHEIGAIDSLVDIVGALWGLHELGIEKVYSSPLPWFRGKINCAHGKISLPAPATALLLLDKPVQNTDYDWEIITPTGALIIDQVVNEFSPGPCGVLRGTGIGFGKSRKGFNGLRVYLLEEKAVPADEVYVLESNVDHLTGEELGLFFDQVLASGALDVIYLPGVMKKNRPGGLLQVICPPEHLPPVEDIFFKHSLTLGLRIRKVQRVMLPRQESRAKTKWGDVNTKKIWWKNNQFLRPENKSLKKLAQKTGLSVVELRLLMQDLQEID
ncbi:nickel pincer cofactor biosynthesis protein LarC [Desulfovulcanus sp.]